MVGRSAGGGGHRRRRGTLAGGDGGWSLLECLAALGIAVVAAGAVVPSVASAIAEVRLRAAAVQVGAALARVRAGARAEGRPFELRVTGANVFECGPLGGPAVRERLPGSVVFAGVTSGGSVRVSPAGIAENATFRLSLAGRERRVVVNQRGRIDVE